MAAEILKLSWQVQLAVASGYAAYILSFSGIREHHKTIDVGFATLVFSLIVTLALWLLQPLPLPVPVQAAIAFVATIAAGLIWRALGRQSLRSVLRACNISWADDDPSAWAALLSNSSTYVSQIAVLLDDGTWLRCDDTTLFRDAPFGPCRLGQNGDLALYLTHEELPEKQARELKTVRDPNYGDRITYVPAARVRRVTIRFQKN